MASSTLRSDAPFTQLTELETYTLGAWNLAVCSCLFLQGILCAQFAHYMSLNKRDSIWMKLFVAGLVLMTTLKIVQSLAIMWIQNVTTFGDLEAGSNLWCKHWVWKVTIMLEAATAFYVQMFFCRRLWAISRNAYLVIICIVLFLLGLITSVVAIVYIFTSTLELMNRWGGAHLGLVLCGDLLLTGSTICYLLRHSHQCTLPRGPTATILNRLRWVTLQSAAPASLCALINFAGGTIMNATTWTPPLAMVNFIANMVLPQLYVWSAMWTLNSREEICLAAEGCSYTINLLRTSVDGPSNPETTRHQHQEYPDPLVEVKKARLDGPPESMA
ncbi:hypothetical protein DFH08DRAFT_428276 [Mycena albidolilacea]|uniref:DUF6534 domain-containing protein n=1 Tax=Mycena albidolilacea TaxID=1033008 RepID=A0AAD6ZB22_9AGAR|nr:hypothetical protein DFH08DRAFT_428276 [Mycena albidolilacea]